MQHPPSFVWLILLAVVYLSQTVRLGNLSLASRQHVGAGSLNAWTHLFFAPVILVMLNTEAMPALEPVVVWTRTHFLAVVVVMLILAEIFVRVSFTNGIERLSRAVERMRDPDELKGATDALETLGIYDQAIVGLNRLAELSPSSSTAHSHMASLYGILRRFRNAEEHARLAVEVDPENPMGHYYLGMALNELDRTEEALVCFKKARSLGLQLPDAYFPAEVPKTKDDQ